MDLTLYRVLISQLSEAPDLASLQGRVPVPEGWPLVLESIQTYRKQVRSFTVTDGKTSQICVSSFPDLYERVTSLELGTIIHLIDAGMAFDEERKGYTIQVSDVCTLKAYDDFLRARQQEEQDRLAWQQQQQWQHEQNAAYWDSQPQYY